MGSSKDRGLICHSFRLGPGDDLKEGILAFARKKKIKAGCIISVVGSLTRCHLRFANRKKGTARTGHFEILSLTGTFSKSEGHFHAMIARANGQTSGGHVLDGNIIFTTAEIVIGELPGIEFKRKKDPRTGYPELVIKKIRKK